MCVSVCVWTSDFMGATLQLHFLDVFVCVYFGFFCVLIVVCRVYFSVLLSFCVIVCVCMCMCVCVCLCVLVCVSVCVCLC